jgi:hypothetical protein
MGGPMHGTKSTLLQSLFFHCKIADLQAFLVEKLAAMSTAVDASVAVTEQEVIFYIRLRTCSSYQIIHEKIFICVPHCFVI